MKQSHEKEMAELKASHEKELQEMKDQAAMDREIEDNTAAITIAKLKGSGRTAGTSSGAKS